MTKKLLAISVLGVAALALIAAKPVPPVYTFTAYNADGIGRAILNSPNCDAANYECYETKDIAVFAPTSTVTITKVQYMTSGHESGAFLDGQYQYNGSFGDACTRGGATLLVTDGSQLLGLPLDTRPENADPQGGRLVTATTNMLVGPNNPMRVYIRNAMVAGMNNGVPNYCKGGAGNLVLYYTVD